MAFITEEKLIEFAVKFAAKIATIFAKKTDIPAAYTHPTSAGNKHIPSGGSEGKILRWGSNGTAVWGNDNNTTYSDMTGATASEAGTAGLVPAPAKGNANRYLCSDGTFKEIEAATSADIDAIIAETFKE